jgi:UDP-galactopyranose mutase
MVLNRSKQVCLGCDFLKPDVRAACRANAGRLIYTGPIDRYFAGSAAAQARATIIAPL